MSWLKQSQAVTVMIGPFVDEDDGKTAETALTISQADVRLSKNGGNMAQKNEATALAHDEIGVYGCQLDTTDTNTCGRLDLFIHEAGALPVFQSFMVLPANVWDSLIGGSDVLQVHATEIAANLITAASIAADAGAEIADAVWDEALSGHTTAGTAGKAVAEVSILDGAITDAKFSSGALNAIADALLKRDMSAVSGEAARSMLNALRFLRNRWAVATGTLTVYKEDDSTSAWTAAVSDSASADPITGSDPS